MQTAESRRPSRKMKPVRILVVQDISDLGGIWCAFLRRRGLSAQLATSLKEAMDVLSMESFDALIFDPATSDGALPLADFATYRNPNIKILAVTASMFFSDRTVFSLIPNARGVLRQPVRPEDLAAYMEHFQTKFVCEQNEETAQTA